MFGPIYLTVAPPPRRSSLRQVGRARPAVSFIGGSASREIK